MAEDRRTTTSNISHHLQPQRPPPRCDLESISPSPPEREAAFTDDEIVEDLQGLRPRAKTSWDESWDEDGAAGERCAEFEEEDHQSIGGF